MALGFFTIVDRGCQVAAAFTASSTPTAAHTITSSYGHIGLLGDVGPLTQAARRPAVSPIALIPMAGTPSSKTSGPRRVTSILGAKGPTTVALTLTLRALTGREADIILGPLSRSQWWRLPAHPLNERIRNCCTAPAWASSQRRKEMRKAGRRKERGEAQETKVMEEASVEVGVM